MYEELEPQHGSVVLADNPMKQLEPSSPMVSQLKLQLFHFYSYNVQFLQPTHLCQIFCENFYKMEKSARMDDADFRSLPPWKSNDMKVRHHTIEACHLMNVRALLRDKM